MVSKNLISFEQAMVGVNRKDDILTDCNRAYLNESTHPWLLAHTHFALIVLRNIFFFEIGERAREVEVMKSP